MAAAIESQERSTLGVIDQDELGHKLGLDTSATEQKERLSAAVGELVQEGRLKSKSKNDEFLSLGEG